MLAEAQSWAQQWLFSGCGILSLLVTYGFVRSSERSGGLPLLVTLALLNLTYVVASTSWLLYDCFVIICYTLIPLTCLSVFPSAASLGRGVSRKLLRKLSFTDHGIAYFHPPALHIDTEVDGIFVVRGITVNLAKLRVEAHGIEVGTASLQSRFTTYRTIRHV